MDDDINVASYLPGASMAGSALRDVKTSIFDQYSRQNVPKVLITIMTGKPNDEIERSINVLKMACVLMFALGLTSRYSPQSLNQASGEPHSEYVLISETFPEAALVAQKMADKIKKVVSIVKSRSERCVQAEDTRMDIAFIVSNCRHIPETIFFNSWTLREIHFTRYQLILKTCAPQLSLSLMAPK
ncbi:Cartilage matrix protein [Desmophyllum pertusum]|uniref:Cartilage matrix protein n=1 Tax=Desmophyllum pertusum TaxID=174260 RepID=A0A9X0D3S6_9CNID|nr:Cartilage matrix protein [Desmophyllum pertusum]